MSPSSYWTLFIARPGRDRQHVIRDPHGEPRIIFGPGDGDAQDAAILICHPDFGIRLEILDTDSLEEDKGLGRRVVALINTYFIENEVSQPSASPGGFPREKQHTRSKR